MYFRVCDHPTQASEVAAALVLEETPFSYSGQLVFEVDHRHRASLDRVMAEHKSYTSEERETRLRKVLGL